MDSRPRGTSGVFGWALSVWLCVSLGAAWWSVGRLEPEWGLHAGGGSSPDLGPAQLLGPGQAAAPDVVPGAASDPTSWSSPPTTCAPTT
jgi:hypothetical protein